MALEFLGIENSRILLYAYFANKTAFDFESETYRFPVLFLLTRGQFSCHCGNEEMTVTAGEAVICPPGVPFFRRVLQPISLHMIMAEFSPLPPAGVAHCQFPNRVWTNLHRLEPIGFCQTPEKQPIAEHYCRDTICELSRVWNSIPVTASASAELTALLAEMSHRFTEQRTNTELCARLHCSEGSLIHQFRTAVGCTPQQYLTQKRLEYGKTLLIETAKSVKEIASQCGYEDALYFSRLFTRKFGLSPKIFRKTLRL